MKPLLAVLLALPACLYAQTPPEPLVTLRDSLRPSAIKPLAAGAVTIAGEVKSPGATTVQVRVTTSLGSSYVLATTANAGRFSCRFPQDFRGAPGLSSMLLYVDATDAPGFGGKDALLHQAEALLIVHSQGDSLPDLPLGFMDDLIDGAGRKDADSAQWPRTRMLVNEFMRGRGATLMRIARPDFDLAKPADLAWFKDCSTLYDFDQRDRDWSQPLGHRVARGFWQAVWNTWFNQSNDHPWDGNPANRDSKNFRPYTFTNDPADLLVLYQMLRSVTPCVPDNRRDLADGVLENLLAMQHCSAENFALPEASGKREQYTAGAFHYGLFETGEWLTEGQGWFVNPQFRDFSHGGVFNGRAVWALGESLKADPSGRHAAKVREALALALRFCLHDGLGKGYTTLSPSGLPLWNRTAGEHAYLLLGLLSACEVVPELPIPLGDGDAAPPKALREVTLDALNALAESAGPDGNWTRYANATAINIAALAEGLRVFPQNENAPRWRAVAMKAADTWLPLKPAAAERTAPTPMFANRGQDGVMTFYLGKNESAHVPLYIGGHWLHALAVLGTITREARYLERANAILAYYCGDNPLHVRLLNELGAVNNRVTDADGDGIEDTLHWDAYPESTAFVQIGLLHLLQGSGKASN